MQGVAPSALPHCRAASVGLPPHHSTQHLGAVLPQDALCRILSPEHGPLSEEALLASGMMAGLQRKVAAQAEGRAQHASSLVGRACTISKASSCPCSHLQGLTRG